MIIPSEKYLFDRVIKYYNDQMKVLSGEKAEDFIALFKRIIGCIDYGDDCIRELLRLKLYENRKDEENNEIVKRVYFNSSSDETINGYLIELYNSDKNNFHLPTTMKNELKGKMNVAEKILPIITDEETADKIFLCCLTILLECQIEQPFTKKEDKIDCCTRLLKIYDKVKENYNLDYSVDNVLECCLLFAKDCIIYIDIIYT